MLVLDDTQCVYLLLTPSKIVGREHCCTNCMSLNPEHWKNKLLAVSFIRQIMYDYDKDGNCLFKVLRKLGHENWMYLIRVPLNKT